MIRNLKKQGDDDKQLLLLKEQLRLAIKNDEAIAASRRDAQQGIPLEVSKEDNRTLAEQLADDDTQREIARKHLMEFFRSGETQAIISVINKDQIIALNTLWNGIKEELKKVNTKTMTTKDFVTFLNRYTDTAVSLQGALSVGVNEISELKELIPTVEDISKIMEFIDDRFPSPPLENDPKKTKAQLQLEADEKSGKRFLKLALIQLKKVIPTDAQYKAVDDLPALEKERAISVILDTNLPNRSALMRALDEGSVSKVERLVQNITPARLVVFNALDTYLQKILDDSRVARRPPPPAGRPPPPSGLPPRPAPSRPVVRPPASGLTDAQKAMIKGLEDALTDDNRQYLSLSAKDVRDAIVNTYMNGADLPDKFKKAYADFLKNNSDAVDVYIDTRPPAEQAFLKSYRKGKTVIGRGIKRGRGRPLSNKPKLPYKLKVGDGIKVKREPVNVEFGRYILNTNQLKKQILHVKNRQGGALSWFQPVAISDSFTELINEMLKTQSVNKHLLKTLDKDEQKLFYEVMDKAGILGGMGLEKPKNTDDEDLKNKFEILLGEYHAGNNSPLLIQQLRKHIIYFTQKGRIPKNKSLSMLMELS
jgi:hypothetical protein